MEEFVSELITPQRGTFDTGAMGVGLPGLPAGFEWRGESRRIVTLLEEWKQSAPEGGRAGGDTVGVLAYVEGPPQCASQFYGAG